LDKNSDKNCFKTAFLISKTMMLWVQFPVAPLSETRFCETRFSSRSKSNGFLWGYCLNALKISRVQTHGVEHDAQNWPNRVLASSVKKIILIFSGNLGFFFSCYNFYEKSHNKKLT